MAQSNVWSQMSSSPSPPVLKPASIMHPGDFSEDGAGRRSLELRITLFWVTSWKATHRLPLHEVLSLWLRIATLQPRAGVPRHGHAGEDQQTACPEGLGATWGWTTPPCKQVMIAELGLAIQNTVHEERMPRTLERMLRTLPISWALII